jgi:hypothetical protein
MKKKTLTLNDHTSAVAGVWLSASIPGHLPCFPFWVVVFGGLLWLWSCKECDSMLAGAGTQKVPKAWCHKHNLN